MAVEPASLSQSHPGMPPVVHALGGHNLRGRPADFEILTSAPRGSIESAWREFLERADFPCHYVTPEFFAEPLFTARQPFAVLVRQHGRVVAACSGILDHRTVRCGLMSRPQVAIDPTADQGELARSLAAAFREVHPQANAVTLVGWTPLPELHSLSYRERVYSGPAGIVLLDLRRGPDALFRDFSESRRANIRKAIRRGIEVAEAKSDDEIETYYGIYREWSRRKNQPAIDYPLFLKTVQARSNRRLFLARHEGTIIAGVSIRFCPAGVIEYAANASLKADQSLRPNDLLHWRVIEWACAERFRTYSLGGAHLFLRRFGGTIVDTYEYRLDRTFGKRLERRDEMLAAARWLWRQLPEHVRTRIRPGAHNPPQE